MYNRPLGNTGANEGGSLAFGMENGWNRVTAALAYNDDDLTLANLIASETAVDAMFLQIGWLHVAAKITSYFCLWRLCHNTGVAVMSALDQ